MAYFSPPGLCPMSLSLHEEDADGVELGHPVHQLVASNGQSDIAGWQVVGHGC